MRVNHIFGALLVATTIGIGGTTLTAPTTAQAKAKSSLKAFPKSMRGTWYHYEENNGYYYKSMKFTAKKQVLRNYFASSHGDFKAKKTLNLHQAKSVGSFRNGFNEKKVNQVSAFVAKKGYTRVLPYGIFASDGLGTYKVIHKNYKGKSVKVLYKKPNANDLSQSTDHFYQTKTQAKYFNPVGALHK
ncbi:hypothetical protein [Levilactobacillus yiduensis]|uniref:hypothetical protein n=1 Tax=Levilactobacillus yiduensis TaxID=2953880 RepID=UPI000EF2C2E2|nr:hypothetical protein [Levilactobacillus yiduensis]AYM02251.1 hypothetical protein D8911_04305 [Levilactobacillus brevis]